MRVPTPKVCRIQEVAARAGVSCRGVDGAAKRWAELLDGWTLPDEILYQAPEDPWRIDVECVEAPAGPPEDTPSRRLALDALPDDGVVLDVGCGAGAASLALVPPAGRLIGLDTSPVMLRAFVAACRRQGVAYETVEGEWPTAAALVPTADVAICHHVAYNVRDIVAFVVELTGRARRRVVVELGAVHPLRPLRPLWRHFWNLERPPGPTAGDFLAVLQELEIEPIVEQAPGRPHLRSFDDAVTVARRRLCLPVERTDDVAAGLRVLPPTPAEVWTFAWPGDA
jgi:SAM-dependent methyltransferase